MVCVSSGSRIATSGSRRANELGDVENAATAHTQHEVGFKVVEQASGPKHFRLERIGRDIERRLVREPGSVEDVANRIEQPRLLDATIRDQQHARRSELMGLVRALRRRPLAEQHARREAPGDQVVRTGHSFPTRLSISA